jgi:predicted permease
MSWLSRFVNSIRSGRLDRDLADEIQFHVERRIDDNIRGGMSPEDAVRAARRNFGNQLRLRESSRDIRLLPWLESIAQDVRFGLRMLRKNPAITSVALLSLSLSIGACTMAFSLLDSLVLRQLPVRNPETLVDLTYPQGNDQADDFSYPLLERLRDGAGRQVDLFGVTFDLALQPVVFDASGPPGSAQEESLRTQWISGNGFAILGIHPTLGRLLTPADDQPSGGNLVAVLSHTFWVRRFGGNPAVLGRWLTLAGRQFQIVGVAEPAFSGLEAGVLTDLWAPLTTRADRAALLNPDRNWFKVWGSLGADVAPQQVRQALQAAFTEFRRQHAPSNQGGKSISAPLSLRSVSRGRPSLFFNGFRETLAIVILVASLVLLIACSNVANLLAARTTARGHEMAMRRAIGAGRLRLVRQMLVESTLLAVAACALGLALASAAAPSIVSRLAPTFYPAYLEMHTDWRALAFLLALCVATVFLFGTFPALRASAVAPNDALKTGGAKPASRLGLLQPILAVQIGFSLAVMFVGGLLLLSFQRLITVPLGFSQRGVVLFTLSAMDLRQPKQARVVASELLDRIRRFPGVQAAGLSNLGLIGGEFSPQIEPGLIIPGREHERLRSQEMSVSPGFFETMRIHLLEGRDFTARDADSESGAVIVSESFAQRYFPEGNSLGKRFHRIADDPQPTPLEIIGVVADTKYNNLRETSSPTIYEPLREIHGVTLEVRTATDPLSMTAPLREEIQTANPVVRVINVELQSTRIENTIVRERLLALLSGFFAVVAVILVATGLYGVLSYSVVRRTKEIGIRLALGAPRGSVVWFIIRQITLVVAVGLAAGLAGGLALARVVAALLYQVKPSDFWSLALPLASLLAVATIAALGPAIHASRVDPQLTLRHE